MATATELETAARGTWDDLQECQRVLLDAKRGRAVKGIANARARLAECIAKHKLAVAACAAARIATK